MESCPTDDPLTPVYMQQTSFNTPEYIASCRTGYELAQKESIFTCHKQQWRPSAPRCAPVVRSSTQSDTPWLYTSTSSTGKTHPFSLFAMICINMYTNLLCSYTYVHDVSVCIMYIHFVVFHKSFVGRVLPV